MIGAKLEIGQEQEQEQEANASRPTINFNTGHTSSGGSVYNFNIMPGSAPPEAMNQTLQRIQAAATTPSRGVAHLHVAFEPPGNQATKIDDAPVDQISSTLSTRADESQHSQAAPGLVNDRGSSANRASRRADEAEHPSRIYTRQLFPLRFGYPLYYPEPSDDLPVALRKRGFSFGDVGVLMPNSSFEFAFNIFCPADDPINYRGVPVGFTKLVYVRDISIWGNKHAKESELKTGGRYNKTVDVGLNASASNESTHSPAEFKMDYKFATSTSESALLTMPHGAMGEDYRCTDAIRTYAIKKARSWYTFINGSLERRAPNGSLYIVTGCDKSTTWGIVTNAENSLSSGLSLTFTVKFVPASAGYSCSWNTTGGGIVRNSSGEGVEPPPNPAAPPPNPAEPPPNPLKPPSMVFRFLRRLASPQRPVPVPQVPVPAPQVPVPAPQVPVKPPQNQCLFVRGFKILLREGVLNQDQLVTVESITEHPDIDSLLRQNEKSFPGSKGAQSGSSGQAGASQPEGETSQQEGADDWIDNEELDPFVGSYHALDTINKYMLEKTPQAQVAISHESDWWDLSPDTTLAGEEEIISRLASHTLSMESGGVFLASREDAQKDDSTATRIAHERGKGAHADNIGHFQLDDDNNIYEVVDDDDNLLQGERSKSKAARNVLQSIGKAGGIFRRRRRANMTEPASRVYARQLLPLQNGYPLFIPEPSNTRSPVFWNRGVSIGDVGILTRNGSFQFVFNIFCPADDPINYLGVPVGFHNLTWDDQDITRVPNKHANKSELKTGGIYKKTVDVSLNANAKNSGLIPTAEFTMGYNVAKSSSGSALLVLPDGAMGEDYNRIEDIRTYSKHNGLSWYEYINGYLGLEASNGSLHVVTGCDKSTTWGIATVLENTSDDFSLQFDASVGMRNSYSYSWHTTGWAILRSGPDLALDDPEPGDESRQNQCLFIRGFKITVREGLLSRVMDRSLKVESITDHADIDSLLQQGPSFPRVF